MAEFHACHWELKDEESTVYSLGGFGGDDYPLRGEQGEEQTSTSWGEMGEKLHTMREPLLRRIRMGLLRSRKHRTIVHGMFKSSNLILHPSSDPEAYSTVSCCDFKLAGRGYGVLDVATLLCESVQPTLLTHDQREAEFLELYFQHLSKTLQSRKRPPLPPGYKLADCTAMYELSLLAHCCRASETDTAGGYEYATWRCRQLCDKLEMGYVDMDASTYSEAIQRHYPLT